MGIRNLFRQEPAKSAEFVRFRNGLPRQSVPQGHLLRGADWRAMTGFSAARKQHPDGCCFLELVAGFPPLPILQSK